MALSPRGLKIGVNVRFKNPDPWKLGWDRVYREHLEYAAAADRLGFDGVWVPEHHCVPSGYNPAPFVSLAALAQATTRCWIGTQPLLLPLYNPVMAAEQAAVVDVLSGGRLILGVAAGYRAGDFEVLGFEKKDRGALTEEALGVLLRALRGQTPFDHQGRFYKLKGVELHPQPLQAGGPEVQLAVRSAPAARRAAKHGVSVNLHSREAARQFGPVFVETLRDLGQHATDVRVGLLRLAFLGPDEAAGQEMVAPYMAFDVREYDEWQTAEDPDDKRLLELRRAAGDKPGGCFTAEALVSAIIGDVEAIRELGLTPDWINLSLWPPGMPLRDALACLERVAEEVLPKVQGL